MKDNKLLKANISHSHEVDLKEINRYLKRNIIINKIESSENCFNLKIKKLYEDILIKSKEPETIPKFNGIKTQLYLKLNKNLPNDIGNLSQVDVENDYFKTEDGENFVIYNDNNVIILQSKFQSKIMFENSDDIFLDGTFYSAPKCVYQILIIRVNIKGTRTYATTCFALCSNKKEELYYLILSEINKNLNYNNDGIFKPYKIHIDFEIGLSNAIIRVWNESQIKYCFFHFQQIIERKRKKYLDLYNDNIDVKEIFNKLNSYFDKKPSIYKLINVFVREEFLMRKDYESSITNGFKKMYRLSPGPGEYFDILPYYIEKDNLIKGKTVAAKKEKINLWFDAALKLPFK